MPPKSVDTPILKIKCCTCNELFPEDEIREEYSEHYCEDCHSDTFIMCESCGDSHRVGDALCLGDQWFCCTSCAGREGWHECDDCSEWVNTNGENYYNHHENSICSGCAGNYSSCDDCGDIFHNDNLEQRIDGVFCEGCGHPHSPTIKDYSYKPSSYIYAKMPWENTTYLGIELEVESSDDAEEDAKLVMAWLTKRKLDKQVYLKEDGSLNNGFEIVFHPFTLQAIHRKFPMMQFLKYLRGIGLSSYEEGTCGLHVHLSCKDMTDAHLLAGKVFFYKCKEQLIKFSSRDDLEYCKFDTSIPLSGTRQECGRYSAFNTCASSDTVEIRLFRGTLEYKRFQASLQLSDAFGEYIKQVSLAMAEVPGEVVWQDFLKYCKRKSKYGQMLKFIKGRRIV